MSNETWEYKLQRASLMSDGTYDNLVKEMARALDKQESKEHKEPHKLYDKDLMEEIFGEKNEQ